MIGLLQGSVEIIDGSFVILNVNGVGYKVILPTTVLSGFKPSEKVKIFIHTHVREDQITLFGFSDFLDLKLFEKLIVVSGIGPKTALGIFSAASRQRILEAISKADVDFFSAIPRLGKKNSQKLIIELKSKIGGLSDLDLSSNEFGQSDEVALALQTFGFSTKEINEAVSKIDLKDKSVEEKIRIVLSYLGKR